MLELNEFQGKEEEPTQNYLWKYLDFYKFLHFLENRNLYFSRLDKFDDVFEGASKDYIYAAQNDAKLIRKDKLNIKKTYTNENKKRLAHSISYLRILQQKYFVNCFFTSENESDAMWKFFSGSFGVIIKFNSDDLFRIIFDHFETELKSTHRFYYGMMEYAQLSVPDYITIFDLNDDKNAFNPFVKDSIYQFEQEYRFVFEARESQNSSSLEISIPSEIEFQVFLPADIENWQFLLLEKMLERYGVINLKTSNILNRRIINQLTHLL